MQQPGGRQTATATERIGEISRKHGNTLVRSLRRIYGEQFARGFPDPVILPPEALLRLTDRVVTERSASAITTGNFLTK